MSSGDGKSGGLFREVYSGNPSNPLYNYVIAHNKEPEVLAELRQVTREKLNHAAVMQISPEQGTFLSWLVAITRAKKIIELGVFTGYSSISMAKALPEGGKVLACDRDGGLPLQIAREYWGKAGVVDKIEERIAPGAETLDGLIKDGHAGEFDLAFVDADKQGYPGYYEQLLVLLRPGGTIVFDNMLWHGRVADASDNSPSTEAIRSLNDRSLTDDRVTSALLAIGDGMLVCTKK